MKKQLDPDPEKTNARYRYVPVVISFAEYLWSAVGHLQSKYVFEISDSLCFERNIQIVINNMIVKM